MSVLKIELLGSEILRRRATEIAEVDEDLGTLIQDMFDTMYEAEGIGLAGPQVGVARRVIVVDLNDEDSDPFAIINPCIVEASLATEKGEEGCLSIPGISAPVERAQRVVVEGRDEHGQPMRIEAEGLLARCLLHEIDHLDGILFLDRVSPLKRSMLVKKWRSQQASETKVPERRPTFDTRAGG